MASEAIQCLGGNGYINDYPTGRLLRDAKLYEIGVGTSEIRRMLIGRELFKETLNFITQSQPEAFVLIETSIFMSDVATDKPSREMFWCLGDAKYERYHDTEWGVPGMIEFFYKNKSGRVPGRVKLITILRKEITFENI